MPLRRRLGSRQRSRPPRRAPSSAATVASCLLPVGQQPPAPGVRDRLRGLRPIIVLDLRGRSLDDEPAVAAHPPLVVEVPGFRPDARRHERDRDALVEVDRRSEVQGARGKHELELLDPRDGPARRDVAAAGLLEPPQIDRVIDVAQAVRVAERRLDLERVRPPAGGGRRPRHGPFLVSSARIAPTRARVPSENQQSSHSASRRWFAARIRSTTGDRRYRLVTENETGSFETYSSSRSRATASTRPASASSSASPAATAASSEKFRPSSATAESAVLGIASRTISATPNGSGTPTLTSLRPTSAPRRTTRQSAQSPRTEPPASAWPWIAATTGFGNV